MKTPSSAGFRAGLWFGPDNFKCDGRKARVYTNGSRLDDINKLDKTDDVMK